MVEGCECSSIFAGLPQEKLVFKAACPGLRSSKYESAISLVYFGRD